MNEEIVNGGREGKIEDRAGAKLRGDFKPGSLLCAAQGFLF